MEGDGSLSPPEAGKKKKKKRKDGKTERTRVLTAVISSPCPPNIRADVVEQTRTTQPSCIRRCVSCWEQRWVIWEKTRARDGTLKPFWVTGKENGCHVCEGESRLIAPKVYSLYV